MSGKTTYIKQVAALQVLAQVNFALLFIFMGNIIPQHAVRMKTYESQNYQNNLSGHAFLKLITISLIFEDRVFRYC